MNPMRNRVEVVQGVSNIFRTIKLPQESMDRMINPRSELSRHNITEPLELRIAECGIKYVFHKLSTINAPHSEHLNQAF